MNEAYYSGRIINGTNPVYGFIICLPWQEECNYVRDRWMSHDLIEARALYELLINIKGEPVKIYGSNELVNNLVRKDTKELTEFVNNDCGDKKFGELILVCHHLINSYNHEVIDISKQENAHTESVALQAYNLWKQEKLEWQREENEL